MINERALDGILETIDVARSDVVVDNDNHEERFSKENSHNLG